MSTHTAALRQTLTSCSSSIANCGQRVMGSDTESHYCLPTVYQSRNLSESIMEVANLSLKHRAVLFKLVHNRVVSSLPRLYDTLSSQSPSPCDLCVWSGTGASAPERLGHHTLHGPRILSKSMLNDVSNIQCKAVLSRLRTSTGWLYKCEAY